MKIYVLKDPDATLFKVGVTKNATCRAKALARKTGPYQRMTLLVGEYEVADKDGFACEAAVHAEIAAFRYGHGREGFRHETSAAAFLALVENAVCRFRLQAARKQAVLDCVLGEGLLDVSALPVLVVEALRERAAAAQEAKRFELQRTSWDEVFRTVFAGCSGVVCDGVPALRWQNAHVTSFDMEAFRADHPALSAQYSTQRVQRRLCFGPLSPLEGG
jgi:hypothetical protein